MAGVLQWYQAINPNQAPGCYSTREQTDWSSWLNALPTVYSLHMARVLYFLIFIVVFRTTKGAGARDQGLRAPVLGVQGRRYDGDSYVHQRRHRRVSVPPPDNYGDGPGHPGKSCQKITAAFCRVNRWKRQHGRLHGRILCAYSSLLRNAPPNTAPAGNHRA